MKMDHSWRWQKVLNIGNCCNIKVRLNYLLFRKKMIWKKLIPKSRNELLDQKVPAEKLKTRNLELFNEGQKAEIKTEGARFDWLSFLNLLQLNKRSLVNMEKRMKFSNAVLTSNYNVICLCETWLNENILTEELLMNDYDICRKDKQLDGDKNFYCGSLVVGIKKLISEQIRTPFPNSCAACRKKNKYIESSHLRILKPPKAVHVVTPRKVSSKTRKTIQNLSWR